MHRISNKVRPGGVLSGTAALIAVIAMVAIAGCSDCGGGPAGEDFVAGYNTEVFTFAVSADPQTLDPGRMSGAPEGRIAFNIFEGLMAPGPTTEDLDDPTDVVVPGVAERYEISEDGRTYTFYLRDDAKWSNGEPLTAKDFELSWKRVLTPGFDGDYVQLLWIIENGEDYSTGEIDDWSEVGLRVVDERTLEVTLEQPTPYFPELVAFYTFYPVPLDVIEEHGDRWTRPENIVGNGAYKLTGHRPQIDMVMEKNSHYWDADNVALDEAIARIIPDTNAVVNAYRTGALHYSGASIPVAQITSLMTHLDYYNEPMLGTYYLRFNVGEDNALSDPKVRRALWKSIDRRSLVEDTMNNLYGVADGYVPPMAMWESTAEFPGYDPSRARQLLAEAGYPDGDGFPRYQYLYNTDEDHKLIAEAIQSMWQRNLGIEINLVNKEWRTYLQDVSTLNYEIARAGWIGDYNDPATFLDLWRTEDGNNNTGWSDEEYDELMRNSRTEPDPDKRLEYLQRAEEILAERGPIMPIYYYTNNVLVSRFVDGFEPHNRDIHLLKYMSLRDPAETDTTGE